MVFSENSNGQLLEIRQFEHYRWLKIDGNLVQSLMDTDNPGRVLLPYTQAMLSTLLFCQQPTSILNLGMGGGAFERYLLEKFPSLNLTTVELSKYVINATKRYFSLPERAGIHNCSAEDYLCEHHDSHDIILCDIF